MDIGTRIKIARLATNTSVEKVVALAEISRNYLSLLENNKKDPSLKMLKKIAYAIQCPVTFLVSDAPLWHVNIRMR